MKVSVDNYKEMRILFNNGTSQREIASKVGVSRNTVAKYCKGDTVPWERKTPIRVATVMTDDVDKFINNCFDEDERENLPKQKHTAKRIYDRLVEEKNFQGSESSVRHRVAEIRGKRVKAFIPLQFEPGEAMQVDWGEAKIYLNDNLQKINIFCARLCYSCRSIVLAYTHQNEESFLDAFVTTFNILNGVPHRVIFDNGRVAVKMGFGANAQKQEGYSKLCAHYGFIADFCNRASGNEKGLVENLVGWARRNILVPVPKVSSLEELNKILAARCLAEEQKQIAGRADTIGALFKEEQAALLPLPNYPFETAKSLSVRVSAYSTVRFQTNEYSVPTEYVGQHVGIKVYPETIVIYSQNKEIAEHPRLFGKNKMTCKLEHYLELLSQRNRAILNAKPVKQNLSREAFEELKANIQNKEKVQEILRREASLPPEEHSKEPAKEEIKPKPDPIKVKKVNLKEYDSLMTLMEWGERG